MVTWNCLRGMKGRASEHKRQGLGRVGWEKKKKKKTAAERPCQDDYKEDSFCRITVIKTQTLTWAAAAGRRWTAIKIASSWHSSRDAFLQTAVHPPCIHAHQPVCHLWTLLNLSLTWLQNKVNRKKGCRFPPSRWSGTIRPIEVNGAKHEIKHFKLGKVDIWEDT